VRILVYEFGSGGGLGGRDVPASLAREGAAMRAALVADLCAIGEHRIVTTAERPRADLPRGVEVATLPAGDRARAAALDRLIDGVDAVWLIAPEGNRCSERLAARVERRRKILLGCGADAIRRASDKARLVRVLGGMGILHPAARTLTNPNDAARLALDIGYPLVVKPSRGAGSHGVVLVRHARELSRAIRLARLANRVGPVILQEYLSGDSVSVSLLADGRHAVALTLNRQSFAASPPFSYRGGQTPLEHPLRRQAISAAIATCRAIPGLRGFIGVDLVLTRRDAVVIEVNPRLTTAYLGVRAAIDENVAALTMKACAGALPPAPNARRTVRFTATGRVVRVEPAHGHRGAA
jgi:predicted ATP-grasp superfamily ATP-dependent carboligase